MIAKKAIEEQIYPSILNMFSDTVVDYEKVGKIIVEVCSSLEAEGDDETTIDTMIVVKNALMLILGLLHRDEPIEEIGIDFKNLPPAKIRKITRDLREIFP